MKRLKLIKMLNKNNWIKIRQGKHEIYKKDENIIPLPYSKNINLYTAKQIILTIKRVA